MWPLYRGTGPLRKLQERIHWWGTKKGLESQLVTKQPTRQELYTQPWFVELHNCFCFRSLLVPETEGGIKLRLQLGTQSLGADSRFFSHSHILCSCLLIQQSLTGFVHCYSVTRSCPTLCDPMDYSTPGFPIPILHYLLSLLKLLPSPAPPLLSILENTSLLPVNPVSPNAEAFYPLRLNLSQ